MRGFYRLLLLFGCFGPLGGQNISCTVSKDPEGTLYSVPEFDTADCYWSWNNRTGHVLANAYGHNATLVKRKTSNTLLLRSCADVIFNLRDCPSQGIRNDVACHASCSETILLNWNHGTGVTTVALICVTICIGLLLLGLLVFLLVKYRTNRHPNCFYSAVKEPVTLQRQQSMEEGIAFSSV